jgi:myo-inositol-1(or 4)-monophosphatase
MKIKMIAIAPYDGWAFIIKDEKLYLLRPPYRSADLVDVSKKDLANAVHKYGFQECSGAFNNLSETINFLDEKYVELMKKQGVSLPKQEELKSLLKYATDEILTEYLDKAEKEFIPQRNLDAAESIALELMRLEKVMGNETMFNRSLDIIQKCKEERNKLDRLKDKPNKLSKRSPNAQKKYMEKAIIGGDSMARIFFSYDHKDRDKVDRVRKELEKRNYEIWVDDQEISVGVSIPHAIQIGINNCDFFAIFLTKNAAKSHWVKKELATFLMRDTNDKSANILPLKFEECSISDFSLLTELKYADFTKDFNSGIAEVLARLQESPTSKAGVNRSDYERLIFSIDLAVRAGTTAMMYYNSSLKENLTLDERKNAATGADRTAQVQAIAQITSTREYRFDTVVSEEEPHCHVNVAPKGYTWVIDPLDGTNNFWNRIPLFCSAIGILKDDEVYYAIDGQPAQVWRVATGETSFLSLGKMVTVPSEALIGTHISGREKVAKRMFDNDLLRRVSSCCKHIRVLGCGQLALAYVATGRLQGFFQLGTYLWDQVAGVVLVKNAGGVVKQLGRRLKDWTYNTKDIIACSNKELMDAVHKKVYPKSSTPGRTPKSKPLKTENKSGERGNKKKSTP